jgi:hypothetical protein
MNTQKQLHDMFDYRSGHLYWKRSPNSRIAIGSIAGSVSNGYATIQINGKKYLAHRLIFMYHHGYCPEIIDHINNNKADNRISNLRGVDPFQNAQNAKLRKDNTSKAKGVCWHISIGKWCVSVRINNKQKHIGAFDDWELAALVAQEARDKYYGSFARDE